MKYIRSGALGVIAAMLAVFVMFALFMIRLEPGEVGVRTQQYAFLGKKGVQAEDYGPGWHRNLPMLDNWNVFDSTVQTTEFTTQEERAEQRVRYSLFRLSSSTLPPDGPERIELKLKDGYTIQLDVTVKYRPKPGEVHQLYKAFNTEERYKGIVRDQVQNTLRNVFGTMRTEEFYLPDVRRSKTESAEGDLHSELDRNHIELIALLVRDITFDKSYERKILDKKLADQDVELNKSRAIAEEKKGETNKIVAETEAMVRVIEEEKKAEQLRLKADTDKQVAEIQAEAEVTVARTQADADLYAQELLAKGMLLEREAKAEGERLRAAAVKGSGGKNLVALEAINNLNLGDMTISTLAVPLLDVDQMVNQMGAASAEN
ncbi:SPFH domain-containing protein [Cerasicoccus fimbriatus]|uniref:SPFH domain-containing protein n=1 Tax=Cerasicoccus fimbriatus TaxID=3014554 RepID=UPI0022B32317|nr:SPFH domain-containing protein [Cerasicoccus sp. TK19100]